MSPIVFDLNKKRQLASASKPIIVDQYGAKHLVGSVDVRSFLNLGEIRETAQAAQDNADQVDALAIFETVSAVVSATVSNFPVDDLYVHELFDVASTVQGSDGKSGVVLDIQEKRTKMASDAPVFVDQDGGQHAFYGIPCLAYKNLLTSRITGDSAASDNGASATRAVVTFVESCLPGFPVESMQMDELFDLTQALQAQGMSDFLEKDEAVTDADKDKNTGGAEKNPKR